MYVFGRRSCSLCLAGSWFTHVSCKQTKGVLAVKACRAHWPITRAPSLKISHSLTSLLQAKMKKDTLKARAQSAKSARAINDMVGARASGHGCLP